MKNLVIFLFMFFLSISVYSQKFKPTLDTNQICLPYSVAQQILLDLNNFDKLKEISETYKKEIFELNKKVDLLKKENDAMTEDQKLNKEIISEKNKSIEIYTSENADLKKENKRLKTKNGLYVIISAVVIAPLTYLATFK